MCSESAYFTKVTMANNMKGVSHELFGIYWSALTQAHRKNGFKQTQSTHPPPSTGNFQATFRQCKRLRFGILTLITNTRSTNVLWQDCHQSCKLLCPDLNFKFHKNLSFSSGDMCKMLLNMHARGIYVLKKFQYTQVQAYLEAQVCLPPPSP